MSNSSIHSRIVRTASRTYLPDTTPSVLSVSRPVKTQIPDVFNLVRKKPLPGLERAYASQSIEDRTVHPSPKDVSSMQIKLLAGLLRATLSITVKMTPFSRHGHILKGLPRFEAPGVRQMGTRKTCLL
jgi:hypothetical protein